MNALERAGYLAHSRTVRFQRRVKESLDIIADTIAAHHGPWTVGCSGGKDSTTLLDLCMRAGWSGSLFYFVFPETPDENTVMVKQLAEHYHCPVHLFTVPGAFDVYTEVGYFFMVPETTTERKTIVHMVKDYKYIAEQQAASAGYVGQFWGLRAAESAERALMLARKGTCYRVAARSTWTCCPLRHWNSRDVWAYITSRGLPWLPRYDRAENREAERSEMTWLATSAMWKHGRNLSERMVNPKAWRELSLRFPEMASLF